MSYTNTLLLMLSVQLIQHPQKAAALVGFILDHPIACQLSRDICVSADRSEQMRENCSKVVLNWHSLPCVYGADYKTQQTNSKFLRSRIVASCSLSILRAL